MFHDIVYFRFGLLFARDERRTRRLHNPCAVFVASDLDNSIALTAALGLDVKTSETIHHTPLFGAGVTRRDREIRRKSMLKQFVNEIFGITILGIEHKPFLRQLL
jgi:hypothetical protein